MIYKNFFALINLAEYRFDLSLYILLDIFRPVKYTEEKTRSFRNKAKATFLQYVLPVFQCDVYNVEINCLFCFDSSFCANVLILLLFQQCYPYNLLFQKLIRLNDKNKKYLLLCQLQKHQQLLLKKSNIDKRIDNS